MNFLHDPLLDLFYTIRSFKGQSVGSEDEGSGGEVAAGLTGSPSGPVKPRWEKDLSLEEVFAKLEIREHAHIFISQGESCCYSDEGFLFVIFHCINLLIYRLIESIE